MSDEAIFAGAREVITPHSACAGTWIRAVIDPWPGYPKDAAQPPGQMAVHRP